LPHPRIERSLLIYDGDPHKHPRRTAHLRSGRVVSGLCGDGAALGPDAARRPADWRIDHVDPGRPGLRRGRSRVLRGLARRKRATEASMANRFALAILV